MADKKIPSGVTPASSPSPMIDRVAKANWKGGMQHGSENPQQVLNNSPTKHPVTPPGAPKGGKK